MRGCTCEALGARGEAGHPPPTPQHPITPPTQIHLILVHIQPHHVVCMRVRRQQRRQQLPLRRPRPQHCRHQSGLRGGEVAGGECGGAHHAPRVQLRRQRRRGCVWGGACGSLVGVRGC